jgi:hypothetical protein
MKPSLGRIVIVTTPNQAINGQTEHAAMITQVWSDTKINLMAMPGAGDPLPMGSVDFYDPPHDAIPSWRWPPRA